MHAEHDDVSCQQFPVIRRKLKSSTDFDVLHRMHVRSNIGVPRRGLYTDELAKPG
jgi:hypothetical protein